MLQKLHQNARTNYHIRGQIQTSTEPVSVLAAKFNLSWPTVKKWRERTGLEDKSSRPDHLRTTLTLEQEDFILFERKEFKKTIEEIYLTLEEIIPNLYPVKIWRVLARHGLSVFPDELLKAERQIKRFRKYTIGYLHLDTVLTRINKRRWYIFTCIDRVDKLALVWLTDRKNKEAGTQFLKKVLAFYPYKIHYILTDNGGEFGNYTGAPSKKTNKIHPFNLLCRKEKIEHRTIKFHHPWTNGMVEKFNSRIRSKVLRRYFFTQSQDLAEKLTSYLNHYNFEVRLRQLNWKTPAQYLKERFNYSIQPIVT